MIHKILLAGDNSSLLNQVSQYLEKFSSAHQIEIIHKDDISTYTLKADEVFVFISENKDIPSQVWDLHDFKSFTNVSANPGESIANNGGDLIKNIAVQRHLSEIQNEDNLFLGALKDNASSSEPFIRESAYFLFNMDAIRASETNCPEVSHPSGLFSEGATQMFRYAGMNELNKVVVISQAREVMSELIAQCLWYYAEAAAIRFPDHPYFSNTVNEYVVDVNSLDLSISFYKSKVSGRWWIKVPDIPENKWKSCSYQDYKDATEDKLNPNLLEVISAV